MGAALLDAAAVRALVGKLDLRPSKRRGQNFVVDANTVRRIVALAGVDQGDVVLEVGPGLGSLTLGLLAAAQQVVAVEIDERMALLLPETVAARFPEGAPRLLVVTADALALATLPAAPTALAANLPYNVAVPVLLHLLETFPSWQQGLVMVQLEVAERLAAAPGSRVYGVPSAKLAWYCQVTLAGKIGRTVFWPIPNVDSALLRLTRHPAPQTTATRRQTFAVIDAAFSQRRKMLRSSLAGLFGSAAAAAEVLTAAGLNPQQRGETLTITDFARIAESLDPSTTSRSGPTTAQPAEPSGGNAADDL